MVHNFWELPGPNSQKTSLGFYRNLVNFNIYIKIGSIVPLTQESVQRENQKKHVDFTI
jgi:hypothetical protein